MLPLGVTPFEFCDDIWHQKTRIMGLPDGVEIMMSAFFVLIQYRRVTDTLLAGKNTIIPLLTITDERSILLSTNGGCLPWTDGSTVQQITVRPLSPTPKSHGSTTERTRSRQLQQTISNNNTEQHLTNKNTTCLLLSYRLSVLYHQRATNWALTRSHIGLISLQHCSPS